jgi:hypothetical protein
VIACVSANEIHDVTVYHPFGNHREPPFLEGIRNPNEGENVRMGQILPHGHLFAETLRGVSEPEEEALVRFPTLRIRILSSDSEILNDLTATVTSPDLDTFQTFEKPPEV